MKRKKGISLIVLVITIIVIIILAVAVILTISQNNPIENAKQATKENDDSVLRESALMEVSSLIMQKENMGNVPSNVTYLVRDALEKKGFSKEEVDKVEVDQYGGVTISKEEKPVDKPTEENIKEEFLSKFNEKQNEQTDAASKLLLSESDTTKYITNLSKGLKISELKGKLPEGVTIKNYDGAEKEESAVVCTEDQLWYKDIEVAKLILFGDVNRDGKYNSTDGLIIGGLISNSQTCTEGQLIACDTNHDGIISNNDKDLINQAYVGSAIIDQNVSIKIPSIQNN